MKHNEPTPTPDRPVPPIFTDDDALQSMMNDGSLLMAVYMGLCAALGRQPRSKHDITRTLVVAAALGDIASIRVYETGFGADGFVDLARNAWLKVEELRQLQGEKFENGRSKTSEVGEQVDATVAALIEKQLGIVKPDKN